MPTYLIEYRLRIRTASTVVAPNGTADALEFGSFPSAFFPYIASPPSGDGHEVDPVTGAARTGAYVVEIVDAVTDPGAPLGPARALTGALEDASNLQQLLGRRAYIERRTDGGAWTSLAAGYVLGIRLASPMRYAITVGDTRRVEQTQPIFTGSSLGAYTTRGCLTGGPVTADFGPVKARGGWNYKIYNQGGDDWYCEFQSGYWSYKGSARVRDWRVLVNQQVIDLISARATVNPFSVSLFGANQSQYVTLFDNITVFVNGAPTTARLCGYSETLTNEALGYNRLYLYWPGAPVTNGQTIQISLTTTEVNERCPLYIDAHPIDIVLAVWSANRIQYNPSAAWINTLRNLIGPEVRLALRFAQAPIIDTFLQNAVFGPFGVSVRTDADGNQELFNTRIVTTATPSLTINTADLSSPDPVIFDLDERSAISSLTLTQQLFTEVTIQRPDQNASGPFDGLQASESTVTARYTDPAFTLFAAKDITLNVPGMIHTATNFSPVPAQTLSAIAGTILPRFGRGAPTAEVRLLASAASAAAQVGDEVYLNAAHYPNRNRRIGESSVGARVMQVVRRTDTPSGPTLLLVDSGIDAQPVSPAAAITIAANANNPQFVAAFTITNAAAINATNVLSVEVEWATGASTPTTNGATFIIYTPGSTPTTAVDLPAVSGSATRVHVRARTIQLGRRPSAWSAWSAVTLNATPTPGVISTSNITDTSVDIGWSNTSVVYPVVIMAFQGASPPADWSLYRIGRLPAGSTLTTIRSLTAGAAWQIALAYEVPSGLGPVRTASLTTAGTPPTATRPAGAAVITTLDDASLPQGIALGLYPSDQTLDLVIERATTSGGAFTQVARVDGSTEVYADFLPRDGVTYYYRLRHLLGGYSQSNPTGEVNGIAKGVPTGLARPAPVIPTVQVEVSETATTGTLTLIITDPQGRLSRVRFRHDSGTGWSAWTIDSSVPYSYTQTLPASGFLRIEYEVMAFDSDGVDRVIAGGVESFDAGGAADFVSVVGTFGVSGDFVLALSADTDTASFKFAVSVASQPTLATVQAASPINGRTYSTTLAGPYDVGTIVYVSALAYTGAGGTGSESVLFSYQFQRGASNIQCLATETTSTNTQSTVSVAALSATGAPISGAQVQLVALDGPTAGKATIASGAAIGAWVTAPGTWVFNRGTPLSGSSEATFRARRSASLTNETDDDGFIIVEEGRDTKPVRSRARIITTTATQCVVRVAVNVPSPYTATTATITYEPTGVGTISLPSGQTVTTGVGDFTTPETPLSFRDFTVDRPAVGQPAGSVTFTAVATGFAPDTDPIAIPPQSTALALLGRARVLTTTATTVVVRVAVTSPVTLSPNTATIVYSEAGVTGTSPASGQTVTPTTGDFITEAGGAPLNYVDFTINRPAFAAGTGRVVFTATATSRAAAVASIDVPAVERDTVPLLARARITATSATSMTVRVAVASPVALSPNTASIAYVEAGVTGTSPASPRSVTPETGNTITELAGSFEDFTITRPAFGAGAGRVTFQVTATDRVAAVASVDVPPQDKDFTPPTFAPTLNLTATTGQVQWPAVAAGVTVEGSTDNVTWSTVTGTNYPTFATGRNAFGGATKFLFVRAYNASGIYTPVFIFVVPPQDPTVPVITKVTAFTLSFDFVNNYLDLDYTISNFPTSGTVKATVLLDGVDQGALVEVSSTQTQTLLVAPVTLSNSGLNEYHWSVYIEVLDSTGVNVVATSATVHGITYY